MTRSQPPRATDTLTPGPAAPPLPGATARTGAALRILTAGLATVAGLALTGCTPGGSPHTVVSGLQLVSFSSCSDALAGLRASAKDVVGAYGFTTGGVANDLAVPGVGAVGAPAAAPAAGAAKSATAPDIAPAFSTTNTAEAGVDEPDLVKTDGKRIVTIAGGVLRVVDAGSKTITGQLDLTAVGGGSAANLLLSGDHALVLLPQNVFTDTSPPPFAVPGGPDVATEPAVPPELTTINGPHLILVDLSATPRILADYAIDGSLLDARQVGSIARVVVQSAPRIVFPNPAGVTSDTQRLALNKSTIDHASINQWLPRYVTSTAGTATNGQVGCDQVYRPAAYTATNVLSVLTFDLSASALGSGRPVSVEADGTTVYATGTSLYVASDQRWLVVPGVVKPGIAATQPFTPLTSIYRFDISGSATPRFTGSGSVPGYLLNQYSMSEWDGKLRVATTSTAPWLPAPIDGGGAQAAASQSAVYVLDTAGRTLDRVGSVGGLGRGERIYAVRFEGPVGYVVTYYQTDPLYTLDLSNPAHPAVRGVLTLSGYSAYLHPGATGRLIGIGQDAGQTGVVRGTQVSLFNVSNLAAPARLAHYVSAGAHSQAEFDPHAFLYWPASDLLVVPLQTYITGIPPVPGNGGSGSGGATASPPVVGKATPYLAYPSVGALLLRVTAGSITDLGFLVQPGPDGAYPATIERSLVIGGTLWTVADSGLMATDITTLQPIALIPFE